MANNCYEPFAKLKNGMTEGNFPRWIWLERKNENDTYVDFSDSFEYKEGKAVLFISADTEYSVCVNGKYVYSGQYADFPWYKVSDEIDITEFLTKGKNAIHITVWFCGDLNFTHYVNRGALIYSIKCENQTLAFSSKKTRCRIAPNFLSGYKKKITWQMGYSFLYDFNATGEDYGLATEIEDMPTSFSPRPIKRLTLKSELNAKKIGNGTVYDLGNETVGYPFFEFKAEKNEKILVIFGERLENGAVPRIIGDRDFSFEVISGGGVNYLCNTMRKLGCRYLEVIGNCEVLSIGLVPTEYPFIEKSYAFDNDLHKKIYDVSLRTLKCNAMEHYFDCPWREQALYGLDSRAQMKYGYVAFEGSDYQRANIKLMLEGSFTDDFLRIVAPTSSDMVIPSFELYIIIALAENAEFSEDYTLVDEYFGKVEKMLEVFINNIENGLVACFKDKWNFYEWNQTLDGNWNQTLVGKSVERFDSVLNLTFIYTLLKIIKVCEKTDRKKEKERFEKIVNSLKANVFSKFFNKENGLFRTFLNGESYSELANALAVLCEVADIKTSEAICAKMTAKSFLIETTLSMKAFKYDAMLKISAEKFGEYVIRDIDESFKYMLDGGATTFWETMLGGKDFDNAGSLCHGWSALPIYYYKKLGVCK